MDHVTKQLLTQLLQVALRLVDTDTANSDKHQAIADSLTRRGRRKFGPRFGDNFDPACGIEAALKLLNMSDGGNHD